MFSKKHALMGAAVILFASLLAAGPLRAFYASIDFDQREFAREEQNLAAQWGIQTANEAMVRLTGIQIALSALTLVGLGVTLAMNARALRQAQASLQHAQEESARQQHNSQKELRAYLKVEMDTLSFDPSGLSFHLNMKTTNTGRTPAENVRISIDTFVDIPNRTALPAYGAVRSPIRIPGGASQTTGHLVMNISQTDASDIADPQSPRQVIVYGRADYCDVFGEEYYTSFAYSFWRGSQSAANLNTGNEAT